MSLYHYMHDITDHDDRVWSLSEQEMIAWDDILDHAVAQASIPAGSAATVFHSLIQRVLGGAGGNM